MLLNALLPTKESKTFLVKCVTGTLDGQHFVSHSTFYLATVFGILNFNLFYLNPLFVK